MNLDLSGLAGPKDEDSLTRTKNISKRTTCGMTLLFYTNCTSLAQNIYILGNKRHARHTASTQLIRTLQTIYTY